MVKLFQLQLEHYEKVEGEVLSLEGKANQLGQMVRSNLPAAMQGLAVVPLFAGYDLLRERGPPLRVRRHRRPLRGAATTSQSGSGSLHAGTVVKLGFRDGLTRDEAIDLVVHALYRPPRRTPPPAGPTSSGGSSRWSPRSRADGYQRVDDAELAHQGRGASSRR